MKRVNPFSIIFFFLVPLIVIYYLFLRSKREANPQGIVNNEVDLDDLNSRQKDIFKYIQRHGEGKVSTMLNDFKGVTDRTLRRDLNKLERIGIVKRSGSTKSVVYRLK